MSYFLKVSLLPKRTISLPFRAELDLREAQRTFTASHQPEFLAIARIAGECIHGFQCGNLSCRRIYLEQIYLIIHESIRFMDGTVNCWLSITIYPKGDPIFAILCFFWHEPVRYAFFSSKRQTQKVRKSEKQWKAPAASKEFGIIKAVPGNWPRFCMTITIRWMPSHGSHRVPCWLPVMRRNSFCGGLQRVPWKVWRYVSDMFFLELFATNHCISYNIAHDLPNIRSMVLIDGLKP